MPHSQETEESNDPPLLLLLLTINNITVCNVCIYKQSNYKLAIILQRATMLSLVALEIDDMGKGWVVVTFCRLSLKVVLRRF